VRPHHDELGLHLDRVPQDLAVRLPEPDRGDHVDGTKGLARVLHELDVLIDFPLKLAFPRLVSLDKGLDRLDPFGVLAHVDDVQPYRTQARG
jgi:hypothetical protein